MSESQFVKIGTKTIVTVMIAALGYVFLGVWWAASTNKALEFVAETQRKVLEKQSEIAKEITEIRIEGVDDRYRKTQADAAHKDLQLQIDELRRCCENHEREHR